MSLSNKFQIIIPPQDIACDPGRLQRLAGGDRDAFAWVYKNYCQKVYDYAMMITNNPQLSEDLVQEVFLRLWVNKEKLRVVENFNAYLYQLYKNLLFTTLKKQQKEVAVRADYFLNTATKVITANDILAYKEQYHFIENAINELPKQQQLVFRLRKENGWKRDQIAKALNVSPFTIKNHMQKAMGKLRSAFKK